MPGPANLQSPVAVVRVYQDGAGNWRDMGGTLIPGNVSAPNAQSPQAVAPMLNAAGTYYVNGVLQ